MKKLLILSIFGLLGFTAFAQAQMTFEETTIDYGTIERGADGSRIFKFTNTGDEPLVITNVRSTCGCTVPKKPTEPILPGKTGEIEVIYDTKRPGPIRRTITVYSNAEKDVFPLRITGSVKTE